MGRNECIPMWDDRPCGSTVRTGPRDGVTKKVGHMDSVFGGVEVTGEQN